MWRPRLVADAPKKYLGIVEALEADIRSGWVAVGEKLPTQRAVAEALDVDLTTVTRAFNEARRRGLLEAQAGRGTFISEKANAGEQSEGMRLPVDFSMNIPPQPEKADFRKSLPQGIAGILGAPRGLLSLHYQESNGSASDRYAGATWLERRLEGVTPDRVVVTAGAQSALFAICDCLFGQGDVILAGQMTYPGLKAVAAQKGLNLEPLAMDEQGIVPEAFEEACRIKAPKALYVIPTLDNPTTATIPEARRRQIAAIAREHGVAIIEDDPYAPLRPDRIVALAELAGDITWHIATLSKCATPGLRIAYVVAPDDEMAFRLASVLRTTILMAPPLMAALATAWIADGTLDEISEAIREENVARQKIAASALKNFRYAADPYGHHLWLKIPDHWRGVDFAEHAERVGLSLVPSAAFAVMTDAAKAVRVSLGVAPDRRVLEDGLTQLAKLMGQPSFSTKAVV